MTIKWVALLGVDGKEIDYYGYSRQRYDVSLSDWEPVRYASGRAFVVAGVVLCDSETSCIDDGQRVDFEFNLAVQDIEVPTVHLRGPFDVA